MTKIGEGGPVSPPTEQTYRTELQGNIAKFDEALSGYTAATSEEKAHYDEIMKQQMALINANVKELKTSGVQKQGAVVSGDYEKFSRDPSEANLTALQQDMTTLKEYGMLP